MSMFQINLTFNHNTTLGGAVSGSSCVYMTHTSSYIQPPITKPERWAGNSTVLLIKGDVLPKLANVIYRKMDLASSHDVVQEGVHSVELIGKKAEKVCRCQVRLAVALAVAEHSRQSSINSFNRDMFHQMSGQQALSGLHCAVGSTHNCWCFLDSLFYEPT